MNFPHNVDSELRRLATVAGGFFAGLSLLVSVFPYIDQLTQALPYIPDPIFLLRILASIVTLAVVGGGYLKARAAPDAKRRVGTGWLIMATAITLAYVFLGLDIDDTGAQPKYDNTKLLLAAAYLAIHALLARGFFDMSLFAYGVRSGRLPAIEGLPAPFSRKILRWWLQRRTKRARLREDTLKKARAQEKASQRRAELDLRVRRAEEERRRREESQRKAAKAMRRRSFLLRLVVFAILVLILLVSVPIVIGFLFMR